MPKSQSNDKRKINLLDFILIVLIIIIVAFTIVSVIRNNPNRISGGDTELTFTVRCEMINKSIADNITAEDSIYDNTTNQLLGTVLSVEFTPITAIDPNAVTPENPMGQITTDLVNVQVVVSAKAWNDEGLYTIDGYRIAAGQSVEFHTEDVSLNGLCTALTIK